MKVSNVRPARPGGELVAFCDVFFEPGIYLKRLSIKLMADGTCRTFSVHSGNDRYSRIVLTADIAEQIAAVAIEQLGGLKANDATSETCAAA